MTSRGKPQAEETDLSAEILNVIDVKDMAKETGNLLEVIQKYVKEGSNPKQLAIGGVSGWITGYMAMKIGKTVATAVGGTLIILQIANHKGYININWSKVNKDLEGASKKLAKGGSDPALPKMLDKAADFLDEQADKAGRLLRKKKNATNRWYHKFVHGRNYWNGTESFYIGFTGGAIAGVLLGTVF